MERYNAKVKLPHFWYNCPTCLKKHYHGFSETEKEPFRRVSHCSGEDHQNILIYLEK